MTATPLGAVPSRAVPSRLVLDIGVALLLAAVALLSSGLEMRVVPALYIAAVTAALWRGDLADRRLPNRMLLPGLGAAFLAVAALGLLTGRLPALALLSGSGYFAFLLVLGVAGGMGMGDVKLGALLGLAAGLLGPSVAILSPVLAFTAGGVAGVIALARRSRSIPFGPYLLGGFWAALLLCAAGAALGGTLLTGAA